MDWFLFDRDLRHERVNVEAKSYVSARENFYIGESE